MDSILLDLGIIQIRWYSLFIFLAIVVATFLVIKEAKKKDIPEDYFIDLIFYGIIIGILGARLYYVLFNLDYYLRYPQEILMIWNGGLAIHGGIIAGTLFLILYTRRKEFNTLKILDICVPGLLIGQTLGRWGNFFNQEAHGPATTLEYLQNQHIPQFVIDGMNVNGTYYIPTFFYESMWCLLGLLIILIIRRLKVIKVSNITSIYLIWYGIGRFIIESYRTDSLMMNTLKQAQIISIIMIIIAIILFVISIKQEKYNRQCIIT